MTTRTRTTAEVEAGAIGIVAAIYRLTPNEARADWERKDNYLYSRDWFLGQSQSCLAAADAAAPAVGVSDRGETAIEAARELLLMLQLEVMTGASLVSPAVTALMTELDNAIFAWDAEQMEPGMGEEQS